MVLRIFHDVVVVNHDEAAQIFPPVADDDRVSDEGRELQLVLDLRCAIFLPPGGYDDVFHSVGDLDVTIVIDLADVTRVQPAVPDRLGCLGAVVEITEKYVRTADQYLVLRRQLDLSTGEGRADRAELLRLGITLQFLHFGAGRKISLHFQPQGEIPIDEIG